MTGSTDLGSAHIQTHGTDSTTVHREWKVCGAELTALEIWMHFEAIKGAQPDKRISTETSRNSECDECEGTDGDHRWEELHNSSMIPPSFVKYQKKKMEMDIFFSRSKDLPSAWPFYDEWWNDSTLTFRISQGMIHTISCSFAKVKHFNRHQSWIYFISHVCVKILPLKPSNKPLFFLYFIFFSHECFAVNTNMNFLFPIFFSKRNLGRTISTSPVLQQKHFFFTPSQFASKVHHKNSKQSNFWEITISSKNKNVLLDLITVTFTLIVQKNVTISDIRIQERGLGKKSEKKKDCKWGKRSWIRILSWFRNLKTLYLPRLKMVWTYFVIKTVKWTEIALYLRTVPFFFYQEYTNVLTSGKWVLHMVWKY